MMHVKYNYVNLRMRTLKAPIETYLADEQLSDLIPLVLLTPHLLLRSPRPFRPNSALDLLDRLHRTLTAPQPNKPSQSPPLDLQIRIHVPLYRTWIRECPFTWGTLMVKMS